MPAHEGFSRPEWCWWVNALRAVGYVAGVNQQIVVENQTLQVAGEGRAPRRKVTVRASHTQGAN